MLVLYSQLLLISTSNTMSLTIAQAFDSAYVNHDSSLANRTKRRLHNEDREICLRHTNF